ATRVAALGSEIVVHHHVVGAHGKGTGGTHHAPDAPEVAHGHTAKGDDAQVDTERFFRVIDKAVWERHTRVARLPLVVAALPEHQTLFRSLSHNVQLVPDGVEGNPQAMSSDQLRDAAWSVMKPRYREALARLADDFHVARARGHGSDDLTQV